MRLLTSLCLILGLMVLGCAQPSGSSTPAGTPLPTTGNGDDKPAVTPAAEGEKPAAEGEKPAAEAEKPAAEEKPADKPAEDKPADKPAEDKPAEDKAKEDKPAEDK
jgi:ribonuclease E